MTPLVPHLEKHRNRWMFPRNIRRVSPWKMAQILTLMQRLSEYSEWNGNQELQNGFCKALEEAGLKRAGVQYDPNSGGPRTYIAQLECLGLVFKRNKGICFTVAGQDILDGKPPLPIMQHMLLRHQYPSAYGHATMVKINPALKIKPFLFILELLNHPEIGHLTGQELAVPLLYGHNRQCFDLCAEKILQLRAGASLSDIIDDPLDLYTPRGQKFPDGLIDDANACKNYLQACCFIYTERIDGHEIIRFDEDARAVYDSHLQYADDFISCDDYEAFQRRYGSWDRAKDTRSLGAEELSVPDPATSMILSQFYELCGGRPVTQLPEEFLKKLTAGYGFSRQQVLDAVEPHLRSSLDYFESTLIELSRSGRAQDGTRFEKAVTSLFKDRLLFNADHTGQRHRRGTGGYADIFLVALDDVHCGIVDTKASPSYSLPHSDLTKMVQTYIPSYRELCGERPLRLEFASYVAGGFSAGVTGRLAEIEQNAGVPCSAITARELLSMSNGEVNRTLQENARRQLSQSQVLS